VSRRDDTAPRDERGAAEHRAGTGPRAAIAWADIRANTVAARRTRVGDVAKAPVGGFYLSCGPERSVAHNCLTQTGKKQAVIPRVNHETGFCMANSLDAMPGKGGW
jgi:hypothetical protein